MNRHFILFAIVFAAALSGVAKTFDVDISTGRPAASNEAYYHGETIEFRAVRGRTVVTNIEYGCIYYQTNGMADVWWRTDGLTFHPTNDVGAASYRFFMEGREIVGSGGVESGGVDSPTPSLTHSPTISRDWHANGLLRLLPSPGFTPNEITMPVATLDFAAVEVLNPPYYDKAETEAKIVELAPAPGGYAAVSNAAVRAAITNALQDTALESHASQLSQLSQSLDGKADREIVIGQGKGLPGDCFPIAYVYNGDSYSIANSGGIVVDQIGPAYYRLADSVTGVAVCYFRISDGAYFSNAEASGITFGGTAPTQRDWPVLCDVAKKSSVVYDVDIKTNYYTAAETEAKIIELAPAPGDYAAVSNAAMNALSRAEAGLSAWSLTPNPQSPWSIQYEVANGLHAGGWFLVIDSQRVGFYEGEETATTILFADYTATRTRLPTMADIPTEQINAATTTNALQDAAIESNRVNIASHSAAISTLSDSISTLNDTKASKADATLTERGPNKDGFSAWTVVCSDTSVHAFVEYVSGGNYYRLLAVDDPAFLFDQTDPIYPNDTATSLAFSYEDAGFTFTATRTALPGYVLGSQTDKPLASEAEAAANRSAISTLTDTTSTLSDSISTLSANKADRSELAGYATPADVYRIVAGTNVVLVVTNYNSAVHAPSMKLQHLDPETGEYVTYWDEARGHGITLTNAMNYADGVAAALDAAKAPRAWSRTTSGLGADAPEGTTFISTPVTHISGGFEFEKKITAGGTVWTLCSTSLAAGSTTNGFFEISALDGTPVFSVEKTDSVLVGVDASAIAVVGNTCVISVPAVADTHPFARVATTLVQPTWYKETEDGMPAQSPATVSWSGQSGAWVATVDFGATPQGFVFFEYLQEGGVKIVNSAVVDLSQGVHYGGATYMPTVSGNELKFIRQ